MFYDEKKIPGKMIKLPFSDFLQKEQLKNKYFIKKMNLCHKLKFYDPFISAT